MNKTLIAASVSACALLSVAAPRAASPAVERAFAQFWSASSPAQAASAADALVKTGVGFDEAMAALKKGRTYAATAPHGIVRDSYKVGDVEYAYTVEVPDGYTPAKRYQLRMQLHGGVGRPDAAPRGAGIGPLAGATEQIYVMPTAWSAAEWWTDKQLENLRVILDRVKRTWNVDENRVVLSGVSDGGTGTYYMSMRDTTPFAAFLPLNGAIAVLRASTVQRDGEMFMHNLLNKPFFIVNGGQDPLYPPEVVEPYINQMKKGGVALAYLPQPTAGHNTSWWPQVKDVYEKFVTDHPRQPLPDSLTWESDLSANTGRADWLVIDTLAPAKAETTAMHDLNNYETAAVPNFGIRNSGSRVTGVTAGSNAAAFGLRPGDVIAKIGPRPIPNGVDVVDLLSIYDPGTPLTLTVTRDGAPVELAGTFNPTSAPRVVPFFEHAKPSGRVDLVRSGNTVTATTRGVGGFTLLISPDQFDFSKPVKVIVDGTTRFDGRVTKSPATLLKWAARDNDRTMLFGAEIKITIPR